LGQKEFDFKLSGKFTKLTEICETIRDKKERVLVFTQFKEMTAPIAKFLGEFFGKSGLVFHGSTAVKKRGELVATFNGEEYVPVAEKKKKAQKKLAQLRKKDPDIEPVVVEGRAIAKTFWGSAWNRNLTNYADYSNRICRGRSYVKNGLILDLKIDEGKIF